MPEPTPSTALRRVLVPLDGSAEAESVLPYVGALAGALGLEVILLRVTPTALPAGASRQMVEDMMTAQGEAEGYLADVAERLAAAGLTATRAVRVGEAAAQIVTAVREFGADLVAMTTHGRTGLRRLLFGSVAEAVLRQVSVPVFLRPVGDEVAARKAA